eukprot:GHVQ01023954.1.p1 GENE.GHVQ01023954.1~~GHVQ01023954.1.p1  ORF type:complete len:285 (+),score=46.52 GHVQ01023954.1:731-1585(+)
MSGLFSCCGYDTVSDKDATLNVSVMSQTSPVAGRPVGDLLMHGGTQPNGHTDLSEDKVFVNGKITAANSRSTDQGGGDAEAGERRGVTVEQGQEEGSGGTGDSKSRLGDREEYMNDGGSSLIALTAELKEKEKLRLQVLVKSFAKSAVAGVSCRTVDSATGRQLDSKYTLDKSLTTFTVVQDSGKLISWHMSQLQEVYSHDDLLQSANTEFLAHEEGILSLYVEQKDRLVVLEYMAENSPGDYLQRICLIEQSSDCSAVEARDRFVTCMKILRLYSLTASNNNR